MARPPKKQKPKHGSIPKYVTRKNLLRDEELAALLKDNPRTYDSSLSKPGRICKLCRGFVAGGVIQCPHCYAMP